MRGPGSADVCLNHSLSHWMCNGAACMHASHHLYARLLPPLTGPSWSCQICIFFCFVSVSLEESQCEEMEEIFHHPPPPSLAHNTSFKWGLCEYVIVHTILGGSAVILWISLGGKPKWLPLKLGYHDVMRTNPISTWDESHPHVEHKSRQVRVYIYWVAFERVIH